MDRTEQCVIYLHEMPAHLHECWAVTYPPTVGAKLLTIGHNNVVIARDKTDPKFYYSQKHNNVVIARDKTDPKFYYCPSSQKHQRQCKPNYNSAYAVHTINDGWVGVKDKSLFLYR